MSKLHFRNAPMFRMQPFRFAWSFICCIAIVAAILVSFPRSLVFAATAATTQNHVLFLNSYHKGYLWSDNITRGIEDQLAETGSTLHIEYMDTKRHFGQEYVELLARMLEMKHRKYRYRAVIVSDNNGFQFIKTYGEKIFGGIPVVFCGVNYLQQADLTSRDNMTGVNEEADVVGNIELIKRLHPNRNKLLIITDNTSTGVPIQNEVRRIQKENSTGLDIELLYDVSVGELVDRLTHLDERSSVLFTFFFRDRENTFLEYDEGIALVVENSSVPVYVSYTFSLRDGVMGGYLVDGYDQGGAAAQKIRKILEGTAVDKIPVTWDTPIRLCLDYEGLQKFGVDMALLPRGVETIHKPVTFYEAHRRVLIQIGVIIACLLVIVVALFYGLILARRGEAKQKKAESFVSNIINSMPSVLVGVDTTGIVTHWNSSSQKITGVSPGDAVGKPLETVFPRLSRELGMVKEAMSTREVKEKSRQPYQHGEDTGFEDITVYPLVANGIEGAVIRLDDVTEKVRLEEMMVQSEKMLSVGGLAAGMAHEINNPLAGMIQTANVMRDRLTKTDMAANLRAAAEADLSMPAIESYMTARGIPKMLDRICESGIRAAEIVANMLQFARKGNSMVSSHDMAELLDQCIELAGSDYDLKKKYDFRQIAIIKEYQSGLPPIPCERSKIQQVFLNILRNGAEAMQMDDESDGETLSFKLRILQICPEYVRIEIEDNGPGMEETVRKRVFEPFFTTKPVGMGTGLGLSVSYFIITENHGGRMKVESSAAGGARFIIELPVGGMEP